MYNIFFLYHQKVEISRNKKFNHTHPFPFPDLRSPVNYFSFNVCYLNFRFQWVKQTLHIFINLKSNHVFQMKFSKHLIVWTIIFSSPSLVHYFILILAVHWILGDPASASCYEQHFLLKLRYFTINVVAF